MPAEHMTRELVEERSRCHPEKGQIGSCKDCCGCGYMGRGAAEQMLQLMDATRQLLDFACRIIQELPAACDENSYAECENCQDTDSDCVIGMFVVEAKKLHELFSQP